ncbi:nuclear transport factor 2 family protein [Actinomycetota bacterium]
MWDRIRIQPWERDVAADPNTPAPSALDPTDRIAIADLFSRYAFHFDRNEPELVAELFTGDALVDYGPEFPPIQGRESVADRIRPGLDDIFEATSHHISNVMIDPTSTDRATAIAYVYAWHRYRDGSPDGHLWGQYHAIAHRISDAWRFAAFRLEIVAVTDFHRERMHSVHRRSAPNPAATRD